MAVDGDRSGLVLRKYSKASIQRKYIHGKQILVVRYVECKIVQHAKPIGENLM